MAGHPGIDGGPEGERGLVLTKLDVLAGLEEIRSA